MEKILRLNKQQRQKLYLECATSFQEKRELNGICQSLKYKLIELFDWDFFSAGEAAYTDTQKILHEIYLFTMNRSVKEWNYNSFGNDNDARIIALLFAAEMCND